MNNSHKQSKKIILNVANDNEPPPFTPNLGQRVLEPKNTLAFSPNANTSNVFRIMGTHHPSNSYDTNKLRNFMDRRKRRTKQNINGYLRRLFM